MKLDLARCKPRRHAPLLAIVLILTAGLSAGCDHDTRHDFGRVTGPNTIVGSGNVISESRTAGGFRGLSLSGAGFARLGVSGELDVAISDAGTVEYYGDPRVHVSGEGSVRRMGS